MPFNLAIALKVVPKLKKFDIIYAHAYPASWLAYLAKRFYGIEYVHCYYHLNMPGFFPGLIPHIYTKMQIFWERWTAHRADAGITISKFAQAQLREFAGLESTVIYPKIDCQRFRKGLDGLKIRIKYNLGNNPVVLFVGGLSPQKCVHLLIKAFNLLKQNLPDAKLLIVGKHLFDSYSNELKQMSDLSVTFTGEVPDEDIPYCYAACDVFATATQWEGFNLPLAEAQACGKPVIAFDIGPHPEVVMDGKTGFLIQPVDIAAFSNAMFRLLTDAKLRQDMGENASRLIIENFSGDNIDTDE